MIEIIILSVVFILVVVFGTISAVKEINEFKAQLEDEKKKFKDVLDKATFYQKEYIKLCEQVEAFNEKFVDLDKIYSTVGGKLPQSTEYKGKKALIGDYSSASYDNTVNVLKSLGFDVDVAHTIDDVISYVKYGKKYDIIFSNNVYPQGSGSDCLTKLKKLDDFNTPVVIHTISEGERHRFIDMEGFDEYIVKPVTLEKVKPVLEKLLDTKKDGTK